MLDRWGENCMIGKGITKEDAMDRDVWRQKTTVG